MLHEWWIHSIPNGIYPSDQRRTICRSILSIGTPIGDLCWISFELILVVSSLTTPDRMELLETGRRCDARPPLVAIYSCWSFVGRPKLVLVAHIGLLVVHNGLLVVESSCWSFVGRSKCPKLVLVIRSWCWLVGRPKLVLVVQNCL